jgi:nucleotide-binding universal stress UspA family protein
MKDFLVHANVSSHCRTTMEVAARLTKAFEGHLVGLFTSAISDIPFYMIEETASGDDAPSMRAWWQQARDKAKAAFNDALASAGASGSWREVDDRDKNVVPREARYVDLTIVGQSDPDELLPRPEYQIPERVALESGGPVLVVPHAGTFPTVGRRVLIAWNASAQSARAVRDALPLLKRAEAVTILALNPQSPRGGKGDRPVDRIAAYLGHHGVAAKVREMVVDDVAVGEMILSQAADESADLIVMGAYGHPRARELVLGGATRTLFKQMTAPILMSH